MSEEEIQKRCLEHNKDIHNTKTIKLDAMFMTATGETLDLTHTDDSKLKYLENDTFIICNPNAMSY